MFQPFYPPVRLWLESIAFHVAECTAHAFVHVRSAIEGNDPSPSRHEVHQSFEGCFHRLEVPINVRVIELHVRQYQGIGKVMHEFRTFVEEGCIVLVSLDDEGLSL